METTFDSLPFLGKKIKVYPGYTIPGCASHTVFLVGLILDAQA